MKIFSKVIYTFAFILVFINDGLYAQNWRGVSNTGRNYFLSGNNVKYIEVLNSNINTSGDSVFTFYTSIRDSALWNINRSNPCLDTSAPSWFGVALHRNESTGMEKYLNFKNDTIYFNTFAAVGDSWLLNTDTANTEIIATLFQVDTITIDGSLDSIKKISLQQFKNGLATPAYYNNYVFTLSKNHGWLDITDLYCFTANAAPFFYQFKNVFNSNNLYKRLSTQSANSLHAAVNRDLKFQQGNVWQTYSEISAHKEWVYDSVISSVPVANGNYDCTIRRLIHSESYISNGGLFPLIITKNKDSTFQIIADSNYHTVPLYYNPCVILEDTRIDNITPEKTRVDYGFCSIGNAKVDHKIDTFINNILQTTIQYLIGDQVVVLDNCNKYSLFSAGNIVTIKFNNQLGITDYYLYASTGLAYHSYKFKLTYFRSADFTYGNYTNFKTLNANTTSIKPFKIFPNPTMDKIFIDAPQSFIKDIQLVNLSGNQLPCFRNNNYIDLSAQEPGVYFLKIITHNNVYTEKVVKQ
jgi:hypothetical protein